MIRIISIMSIVRNIRIITIIYVIGIIFAVCCSARSIVVKQVSTPTSKRRVGKPDQDGPDQSPSDQGSSPLGLIASSISKAACLDNGIVSMKYLDWSCDNLSETQVM